MTFQSELCIVHVHAERKKTRFCVHISFYCSCHVNEDLAIFEYDLQAIIEYDLPSLSYKI